MQIKKQKLKLNGNAMVFVDWANVFRWQDSIKRNINPKDIFQYFSAYDNIKNINFYFGTDNHIKSKKFLNGIQNIGFSLFTKPAKYISIN